MTDLSYMTPRELTALINYCTKERRRQNVSSALNQLRRACHQRHISLNSLTRRVDGAWICDLAVPQRNLAVTTTAPRKEEARQAAALEMLLLMQVSPAPHQPTSSMSFGSTLDEALTIKRGEELPDTADTYYEGKCPTRSSVSCEWSALSEGAKRRLLDAELNDYHARVEMCSPRALKVPPPTPVLEAVSPSYSLDSFEM